MTTLPEQTQSREQIYTPSTHVHDSSLLTWYNKINSGVVKLVLQDKTFPVCSARFCSGFFFSTSDSYIEIYEMSNVPFKTSLTPPSFIEVHISSQESMRSCICVLEVTILPLSTILIFHFHFINSLILIKYMGVLL